MSRRSSSLTAVCLAAILAGGGCSRDQSPMAPVAMAPAATSASNAVRLVEWAINHRDVQALRGLLSDDAVFVAAGGDSAGNPTRTAWTRGTLLAALERLLVGSSDHPPAQSVAIQLDRNLIDRPDTRLGKSAPVHRQVRTTVDLQVVMDPTASFEVSGNLLCFATRGDSAAIPSELGVRADSLRWWLDRIEDETITHAASPPARAHPVRQVTLGQVLALYLP